MPPKAAARHPARCSRVLSRYPDHGSKAVEVLARRGLSCAHAGQVGASLLRAVIADRLPLADFPRHYPAAPQGPPFLLTTPRGRFRCHMTAAGSDFVAATCRRGRKCFVLTTIRISRHPETRRTGHAACASARQAWGKTRPEVG